MVPDVVERLHSLKDLHERASQFAGSVTYVSDQQDQTAKQIKELTSLLKEVETVGTGTNYNVNGTLFSNTSALLVLNTEIHL